MSTPSQDLDASRCSAKKCSAAPRWELRWNNPKIHQPERRKVWLACEEHREYLSDFLNRRGFLREIAPFTEPDQDPNQDPNQP